MKQGHIGLTMLITITSEINPILHCNRALSSKYTMQNRIDLRSNSDQHCQSYMPLFQSLFSQSYPLIFPKTFLRLLCNDYNKEYIVIKNNKYTENLHLFY